MYPAGEKTRVRVDGLTEHLCGRSRPGHFEGVTSIVAKLFAVSGPCTAVFGRKDYQQLRVIERMVQDLLLPVTVVGHPTVREPDGLALSSRNAYLSPSDRQRALVLSRSLAAAVRRFQAGERGAGALRAPVEAAIVAAGLVPDYVTLADTAGLAPIADDATVGERAVLALAVRVGPARLIDNVVLGEDGPPGASA
jgi:pantoate--beta-alanine ligase